MKKRGNAPLWFFVELIAAFFVAYVAVDVSLAYAKGTIFEKLNIVRDIGMQINTLMSVPGDVEIIKNDLQGYSVRITGNKIEVFKRESDLFKGTYFLAESEIKIDNFFLDNSKEHPKKLVISKVDNEIKLSEFTS
jgi:hypothetical protein|tara:strand:- start:1065 stop:1469 length:405 start_codon:yes stop_codon:yes gene_type:complete